MLSGKRFAAKYVSKTYTYEEKFKTLQMVDSGTMKPKVAAAFGIPLNTLSGWLENHLKIKAAVKKHQLATHRKRKRKPTFADVGDALFS